MSILKMKKLVLYGLAGERDGVYACMQRIGCIHIKPFEAETEMEGCAEAHQQLKEQADRASQQAAMANAALVTLSKYDKRKKPLFPKVSSLKADDLYALEQEQRMKDLCVEVREMEQAFVDIRSRKAKNDAQMELVRPWLDLPVQVSDLGRYKSAIVELGVVPLQSVEQMRLEIPGQELSSDQEHSFWLVAMHQAEESQTRQALAELGFVKAQLPAMAGTPKQMMDELKASMEELSKEQAFIQSQLEAMAGELDHLEKYADALETQLERLDAAEQSFSTRKAFAMAGWVPAQSEKQVEEQLLKAYPKLLIEWHEPEAGEEIPTLTANAKLVTPFESVTNMYSVPLYGTDIDPNTIMMPFYAMFFGMMVSDAGYGIILAVASFIGLYVLKIRGGFKNILGVLMIGGLFTLFWGAMFGSWFAIEGIEPILFSPMNDPMSMLALCYSLGAVHIFVGMGIKAYLLIKDGNVRDAFFDPICWMLLIIGLVMVAGGMFIPALSTIGLVVTLVGFLGILLFTSKERNILKRLVSGLGSLYGITSYLSDILSYSRLFAMGLATGVIGMVVNMCCGMIAGDGQAMILIQIIKYIFALALLLFGHVFNMAINTLGAYVHACRLQYIEFYGKFFTGGGFSFKPLAFKTKYSQVDGAQE